MAYESDLGVCVTKIIEKMLTNEDLCKLLYYSSDDPLAQPPVPNPYGLIWTHIYPLPKTEEADTEVKTFLRVYFSLERIGDTNKGFTKTFFTIDIISHINAWKINGNIRPYAVMKELKDVFNGKMIPEISSKPVYYEGGGLQRYSDMYYGMSIRFHITQPSTVGCDYNVD